MNGEIYLTERFKTSNKAPNNYNSIVESRKNYLNFKIIEEKEV